MPATAQPFFLPCVGLQLVLQHTCRPLSPLFFPVLCRRSSPGQAVSCKVFPQHSCHAQTAPLTRCVLPFALQEKLPRAKADGQPLPEGLLWLLFTGKVQSGRGGSSSVSGEGWHSVLVRALHAPVCGYNAGRLKDCALLYASGLALPVPACGLWFPQPCCHP